jgi:hypothetical protein
LTWSSSPDVGVSYHVWRAPCNTVQNSICTVEGTFATIATSTATSYIDSTVAAKTNYSYYITAFCPASGCSDGAQGESIPSNHALAQIPGNAPVPPSSLSLTNVAIQYRGNKVYVSATWKGLVGDKTSFQILSSTGKILDQGTSRIPYNGYASMYWNGSKSSNPTLLKVCDISNCVSAGLS